MIEAIIAISICAICVVLPITIVWLVLRHKAQTGKNNKELLMSALEKNPEMDMKSLIQSISGQKKLLKEKLIEALVRGIGFTLAGSALLCWSLLSLTTDESRCLVIVSSIIFLAIGIAHIIYFYVGKNMLAKEIEAEEKQKEQNRL